MCGIWQLLKRDTTHIDYYNAFKKIYPRGPDRMRLMEYQHPVNIVAGFHRLSIMDLSVKGDQPFTYEYCAGDRKKLIISLCNGEIYNYKYLIDEFKLTPKSGSDCEILPELYFKLGIVNMMKVLRGEFAFIISDIFIDTGDYTIYAGRDSFGIKPLFYTQTKEYINFSSEIKGLINVHNKNVSNNDIVNPIRAGYYMTVSKQDDYWLSPIFTRYFNIESIEINPMNNKDNIDQVKLNIRNNLIEAVSSRLMSDRPLGCLLSGGLDSSLVASIASKLLKQKNPNNKLSTFSIGMDGSTDEKYARLVAKHIDSNHTHIEFPEKDWLDAIHKVIYTTETFDITTIRASTGQYLISKWIAENTNIKVLLIGDGSDELTSGYLYFHKAPDAMACCEENIRLLKDISYFDVLRADRGVSGNGLEARVPYLDRQFTDYYLSICPELRCPINNMEKWLLREAFSGDWLPEEVLYRKKEAFSDGVSSKNKSWYRILQESINDKYTDEELIKYQNNYKHCVPPNKEALYFRHIFEDNFGRNLDHLVPYYWLPKWCGNISEPSARVLVHYSE